MRYFGYGQMEFRIFLIPGDPEITKSAAVVLMDDLSDGVNVNDAVTAFCRSILDGAGV